MQTPYSQTTVLADGFCDPIHIYGSNVSQSFNIVDILGNDLFGGEGSASGKETEGFTLMQRVARLGIFSSSKWMTFRLSTGALRFLGAAGFLKGSAPEDFAHL